MYISKNPKMLIRKSGKLVNRENMKLIIDYMELQGFTEIDIMMHFTLDELRRKTRYGKENANGVHEKSSERNSEECV